MTENIKNKVVVITGASSGLGKATSLHLAALGAKLVLGARRLELIESIKNEITEKGGQAIAVKTDVTNAQEVYNLVEAAVSHFGKIDVLINNAGIMPLAPLGDCKIQEWEQLIDINIKGVLYGIAAALPHMQNQKFGHIINVSSVSGHKVTSGGAVYSATKMAVRALSEGLRMESKAYNIRSTVISPGAVDSNLPSSTMDQGTAEFLKDFYKNYAIPTESFARCVAFAIAQPEEMDVNEILFRPTKQEL